MEGIIGSLSSPRDALPSVAVVGGQSSGKSSVLEGIVGKDFLPRGSGMVTRRPLVLQLCKIDDYQQEYAEFSHLPGRKFTDFGMVRKEIWDETNRIPGKTKQISFVPIRLTIHSPHVVNLILIDLPGLTKVAVEGQSESIVQDTESMVRSYIEKPNSIILAIIPANQDIGSSDAIKIAREVDPTGERTLGVLTKLDLKDKGTNALDVLEGRSYRLQHPWVGIVNHSQADINKNVDMVVARRREQEYFATSPDYSHLAHKMGSKYLAKLLSQVVELRSGLQNRWAGIVNRSQADITENVGSENPVLLSKKKEKEKMIKNLKLAGSVVGGIAAVALAAWGLSKIGLSDDGGESSNGEEEEKKKMMKAPGRGGIYIPRDGFEDNPREYFRNLRQKD